MLIDAKWLCGTDPRYPRILCHIGLLPFLRSSFLVLGFVGYSLHLLHGYNDNLIGRVWIRLFNFLYGTLLDGINNLSF